MASLDLDSLLSSNLLPGDLAQISPQAKAAMQTGAGIAADALPALSLIDKLATGATPTEQDTIAAMAGVATLANPLAGAAILAAGELTVGIEHATESLFHSLGLIADAPKPVAYIGGLRKGVDPIPYGPSAPEWQKWGHFIMHSEVPDAQSTLNNRMMSSVMQALTGNGYRQPADNGTPILQSIPANSPYVYNSTMGPVALNDFERFFIPLLIKDIEYWWNANPFIPPRDLLQAAVKAWNKKRTPLGHTFHAPAFVPSKSADYSAYRQNMQQNDIVYDPYFLANDSNVPGKTGTRGSQGVIGDILGGYGDPANTFSEAAPVSVNMGAPPKPVFHILGTVASHVAAINAPPATNPLNLSHVQFAKNIAVAKTLSPAKPPATNATIQTAKSKSMLGSILLLAGVGVGAIAIIKRK